MGKRKSTSLPTPEAKPTLSVVPDVAQGGPPGEAHDEDPEGLSLQEAAFVDAVAAGGTLQDGATAAGISYRTAKRWHRKDQIMAAVRARISASLAQARAVLASGAGRAARSLVELSDTAGVGDAPKISASRAVIDGATKLVEIEELSARLAELEARLGQQPGFAGNRRN